jgi:DNA-binding MarR family transcriptional regulator
VATDEELSRFRAAIGKIPRRLNVTATHEGISPTQASILGLIVGLGPIGLPEIVDLESIHPTMLSRVIRKLSEEGWIERQQDPDDLRSVKVSATPSGRATQARIKAERQLVVNESFKRLSEAHQEALMAALPALEALVGESRQTSGAGSRT